MTDRCDSVCVRERERERERRERDRERGGEIERTMRKNERKETGSL